MTTTAPARPTADRPGAGSPADDLRALSMVERLHIELRKLVDTRAAAALLWVMGGLVVAFVALAAALTPAEELTLGELVQAGVVPLVTLLPVLSILATCGEWRHGTAMSTYALDPRRTLVLLAKIGVVVLVAVAAAIVLLGGALTAAWLVGTPLPGAADLAKVLAGLPAGLVGMTMLGTALGAALLVTPLAIVGYLVVVPIVPQILRFSGTTAPAAPYVDVNAVLTGMVSGVWPTDAAQACIVGLVWVVLPLLVGFVRNARRAA